MREHVLALAGRYLGRLRPSGGSHYQAKCPFHKGGEERKPSFSIDVVNGLWHCFTCQRGGNIYTLLKELSVPAQTIDSELAVIRPLMEKQREMWAVERENRFVNRDPFKSDYVLPEALLGVFEFMPHQLVNDGFDPDLLHKLEIGFDRNNQRIMYPLRDIYGNLAGFSGGITPHTLRYRDQKYRVYEGRRKDSNGRWVMSDYGGWFDEQFPDYRIANHDFLWNGEKVYPRLLSMSDRGATVFVVEGFKACMWMLQCGFWNTVALMGTAMSDRQQQVLHRLGCTVVLFLDNDDAGMDATDKVGNLLWKPMYGRVMVVPYPEEDEKTQPDDYEVEAVKTLVSCKKTFVDHLNSTRSGYKW